MRDDQNLQLPADHPILQGLERALPPPSLVLMAPVIEGQGPWGDDADQEPSYHPPPRREQSRDRSKYRGGTSRRPRRNHSLTGHLITPLLMFKLPSLEHYDGSGDLENHIQNRKTTMWLHGVTEPLLCMAFPTTLWKAAKDWFNSLFHGSIASF